MKTFKSIESLEQVRGDPLYSTIKELVQPVIAKCPDHRPEDDGKLFARRQLSPFAKPSNHQEHHSRSSSSPLNLSKKPPLPRATAAH
jgi:hypothetical protein